MKILSEIPNSIIPSNFVNEQFRSSLYDISHDVLDCVDKSLEPGKTVVLFSGRHRFKFDATYIEPKIVSNLIKQSDTIFADPSNTKLLNYTLSRLRIKNLLILNSGIFIRYRDWEDINDDINSLKSYASQVIVTLPLSRFNFNRLKYSNSDISKLLGGSIIDNTVVVCR